MQISHSRNFSFRLSDELYRQLLELACHEERRPGDLLRRLIRRAHAELHRECQPGQDSATAPVDLGR